MTDFEKRWGHLTVAEALALNEAVRRTVKEDS